jgi:3-hydroxyacyl-CoA dehydrogenase
MKLEDIQRVAVIGAGTMGHGIAQVFAYNGYQVRLHDIKQELVDRGMRRIQLNLKLFIEKGLTTPERMELTLSRIRPTTDLAEALRDADFVMEVVPEEMSLKKDTFKQMDTLAPPQAILASNTSTFMISELASVTQRPDKVIGAHWMQPPHVLPLVEIIRGAKTSEETLSITKEILTRMGKVPIICKEVPGFIVNRVQGAMLKEACNLVEQGICSKEDVDKAWTYHLGLRYALFGPFEALDSLGIDTWYKCFVYMYETLKDPRFEPPKLMKEKVDANEVGLKTGKGFFDYTGQDIDAIIDQRNEQIIQLLLFLKRAQL